MAIAKELDPPSTGISDWLLELAIGVMVILLGAGVWAYTQFGSKDAAPDKPKPVWLTVPKVTAQTADGRLFHVKMNFRLAKNKDADELEPHLPAFSAMVQQAGTQISGDELKERGGITQFSKVVKSTVNGYLKSQDVKARVKDVAFEELMLLP